MSKLKAEFYKRLGELLAEFDVEIRADDDGAPYGQHRPLILVEFPHPEKDDETTWIDADGCSKYNEKPPEP